MRRGLFIGISNYVDKSISSLKYAASDAVNLLNALVESCGFDRSASIILASDDFDSQYSPNLENIYSLLGNHCNLGKCEAFVLYYSGHGFRSSSGVDFIVPQRARQDALEHTSIPLDTIIGQCLRIEADRILIILDGCREKMPHRHIFGETDEDIRSISRRGKSVAILFSARPGDFSYESSFLNSGVFTYALIKLLGYQYNCKTLGQITDALSTEMPNASLRAAKPAQRPYSVFIPDDIRNWVLPISKITRAGSLPDWIGEEIRSGENRPLKTDISTRLAIDFGTTKTVGAYWQGDQISFVKGMHGHPLMPSTVRFDRFGNYTVGETSSSGNQSENAKRALIDRIGYYVGERYLSPKNAAAMIVGSLVRNFEEQIGYRRHACVTAVPTDYNVIDVGRLIDSIQMNKLRVDDVIREPTAAAFNIFDLMSRRQTEITSLVIDLGGGTLDVSIVSARKEGGILRGNNNWIKVLASSGDRRLGGIDFNQALFNHICDKISRKFRMIRSDIVESYSDTLAAQVEQAKIRLSELKSANIVIPYLHPDSGEQTNVSLSITYAEFVKTCDALFERIYECIDECIKQATIWESEYTDTELIAGSSFRRLVIESIIIAGQAGQMRPIIDRLSARFPKARIVSKFADCAVARGLAIASGMRCERTDIAYYLIGVAGLTRAGNFVECLGNKTEEKGQIVWFVYPDDTLPTRREYNFRFNERTPFDVWIVTSGSNEAAERINRITADLSSLAGPSGTIAITVDGHLTIVLEIIDFKGKICAWQVNNLYRIPDGYSPVAPIELDNPGVDQDIRAVTRDARYQYLEQHRWYE